MAINRDGVTIGTISGGIVNFGGAVYISPISITRTTTGAGEENKGAVTATNSATQTSISNILDVISRSLR
ncbi:spore germination protein [Neobacillus sp. MM2021_6]|uniref:spore germination protein n=1 Tax=Bacillaceae TaxID=186817 RepID=UPI001407580F|nr:MULTISPECIES: spore germination protein [Bacillaceae]MBO0960194.1 spore germination protein [Neobacillus sp. MM2021_6]NHC18575.1 spore germination protein [Bacillus sp. MM2020_4]